MFTIITNENPKIIQLNTAQKWHLEVNNLSWNTLFLLAVFSEYVYMTRVDLSTYIIIFIMTNMVYKVAALAGISNYSFWRTE